jgi:hypothetical protein
MGINNVSRELLLVNTEKDIIYISKVQFKKTIC